MGALINIRSIILPWIIIAISTRRPSPCTTTFIDLNSLQVSSGSLVLTLNPILSTVFYYNIGQTISFKISLSHNSSVSPVSVSDVKIRLSSQFLQLTTVGMSKTKNGSFVPQENMVGDVLELSLSSASFESGNRYEANITTTVKNTIAPLSNLKVSAELNATTDVYIKKTSSPVVYAVYPRVNVTQITEGGMWIVNDTFNIIVEIDWVCEKRSLPMKRRMRTTTKKLTI